MFDWWTALPWAEQAASGLAIGFGGLLFLLLGASLIGGEVDLDVDTDIDLEGGSQGTSVKSILSFLTFFGFGSWAALSLGAPRWLAVVVGLGTGYACASLLALLLVYLMRLGHDGGRDVASVLQQRGEVYLAIPGQRGGSGRLHVMMGTRLVELEALTAGEAIPTGAQARVVELLPGGAVLVEAMPTA